MSADLEWLRGIMERSGNLARLESAMNELEDAVRADQRTRDVKVIADYRRTHALEDAVLHAGLYTAEAVLRKDGPS